MLGSKLRSWMEAVRPRKKQRKEKQLKSNITNPNGIIVSNSQSLHSARSSENDLLEDANRKSVNSIGNQGPRYSGANLSSPESAYSTGYSTDGTSPGAPPEYFMNIKTGARYFPPTTAENEKYSSPKSNHAVMCSNDISSTHNLSSTRACHHPVSFEEQHVSTMAVPSNKDHAPASLIQDNHKNTVSRTNVILYNNLQPSNGVASRFTEVVGNSSLTSPRQRNRIRTNPWVPGNNLSPGNSSVGLQMQQDIVKPLTINSPVSTRYINLKGVRGSFSKGTSYRESLSSSSCSSLSAASINWDPCLVRSSPKLSSESDDEEDCTLNEMMGKYDESYVYEKETDILSDSDPTDCETDIDTGQDGGDEDDPFEHEFDFIDNGSYLENNIDARDIRNTGHCTYYNYEVQRRISRRRVSRRLQKQETKNQSINSKQVNEKRRRANSSKKKTKTISVSNKFNQSNNYYQTDGSRSAGATPLSVRRTKYPTSKLVEEQLKRRSNSVSFSPRYTSAIDQRDKEADQKYKELIVEAEHILMSMKTNGLSPRRLPGPPNKRVELLRIAESVKPDIFTKSRLIEDTANLHLSKIPSTNFSSPRFSPKKNHITNFINNNSPVLMRRDVEPRGSPLTPRKELQSCLKVIPSSPLARNKYAMPKSDLVTRRSPKHSRKFNKNNTKKKHVDYYSSDSDDDDKSLRSAEYAEFCCPQSEPVKRKVYNNHSKTVAFNLNYKDGYNADKLKTSSSSSLSLKRKMFSSETATKENAIYKSKEEIKNSVENLRQQVLLNTIAGLKRSLEDQSASLRQVYNSSQRIHM